jgi:hypothetical protein
MANLQCCLSNDIIKRMMAGAAGRQKSPSPRGIVQVVIQNEACGGEILDNALLKQLRERHMD